MKKQIFVAVTIAALGFTGFRLSTHAMASPAEPAKSPTAAIDKGRVALKNLERSLLAIIGSAKKTKGLTLYLPGKTSKDQIRRTTMETVQFVVGFDAKTGKNRKAMDAISPKVTKAIDAALPTLAAAAQAADAGHVIASTEKNDLRFAGLKKGEYLNIYLGESLPAHIKKAALAAPDPIGGWVPKEARLLKDGAIKLTLQERGSSTKERSATIPAKDLKSLEAIENRILSLVKDNVLPSLRGEDLDSTVWMVSIASPLKKKGRMQFRIGSTGLRSVSFIDESGFTRALSPL